jgi:hypothetical protein
MKKCEYCGKLTKNKKFCSLECSGLNQKKNNINFYNSKFQSKAAKIGGKRAAEVHKINGTGVYSFEIQSMGGKIGGKISGLIAVEKIRNSSNFIFMRVHYSSIREMEIGMCIYYQIEKLEVGKNYQVNVSGKLIDFLIEQYKCFIEYHSWDRKGLSDEEYYKQRRDNLNKNGYKDYNLVVIR